MDYSLYIKIEKQNKYIDEGFEIPQQESDRN